MSILSNLLFYLVGMWLQKLILISFLVSCFIFQNTEGALSRSLSVFESLPQGF